MTLNDWWTALLEEKYWMVAPAEGALAGELAAPAQSADARAAWTHELVSLVQAGDTVFVWDRSRGRHAIVGWARALGPLTRAERTRHTRARGAVAVPHWVMPTSDVLPLARPIDLAALRRVGDEIASLRTALGAAADGPLYFPFIGAAHRLTPAPGYLTKFPRDLFALLNARYGFEFSL